MYMYILYNPELILQILDYTSEICVRLEYKKNHNR